MNRLCEYGEVREYVRGKKETDLGPDPPLYPPHTLRLLSKLLDNCDPFHH